MIPYRYRLLISPTDNRALSKIIFGGDGYVKNEKGEIVEAEPATLEVGMTEANLCNKNLREGGAIIISAWITHKDNGALSLLNLTDNSIGEAGVQKMKGVCGSKNISLLIFN
jgi:hypothetical protein